MFLVHLFVCFACVCFFCLFFFFFFFFFFCLVQDVEFDFIALPFIYSSCMFFFDVLIIIDIIY